MKIAIVPLLMAISLDVSAENSENGNLMISKKLNTFETTSMFKRDRSDKRSSPFLEQLKIPKHRSFNKLSPEVADELDEAMKRFVRHSRAKQ